MKKIWKRMLAAGCAAVMSMTMPGMCVLADEMKEETFVTEAEVLEESVNSVDSLDEDVTEVVAENIDQGEVEEVVGEGPIQVGDGVTATFDADTGAVEFTSQWGELWRNWVYKLGVSRDDIKSLKVASGTVYLPADSSGVDYYEDAFGNPVPDYCLFGGLTNLKSLDLRGFDTSNVTDMSNMFCGCRNITNLDLSSFNTSKVTDMSGMFSDCSSFTNLDLSSFNTSKVTDMSGMFSDCSSLTNLNMSSFNTSKVTDMSGMFSGCSYLTSVNLSNYDTSSVTDMSYMFLGCSYLTNLDLNSFTTSNVEKMVEMFYGCSSLVSLDLSGFDMSNVTVVTGVVHEDRYYYSGMFQGCRSLTTLNLSGFDMSNIWNLGAMFRDCSSLTNLNLSRVNTSNVKIMSEMFWGCSSLANLDISSFDTSNVTDMSYMFYGCSNLKIVDMSNFDTSNVKNAVAIFYECSPDIIHTPKENNISITLPYKMFDSAGKTYTVLPRLTRSIVLARTQQLAKENEPPAAPGFSDVQDLSHPYYNAIYWAAEKGITKGYSDGTFGINRSCTRGEMMMFLWRFAGKPAPKAVSKSPFKDVPKTHTFYKPILWGYQKGITKGYSDGTFGINRNVSRGEAMMFLWKLKGKPAPKTVSRSPFKDVPMSHAFYKAILWGSQKKITVGYTSGPKKGNFGINDNCTRGQIVTFLYRAQ